MSKLYFTRPGADRTMKERQDLFDKLKSVQGQKAEAVDIGGDCWHDNFYFEQLVRDEQMLNIQISQISEKISNMVVVSETPSDTDSLRIGHIAVFEIDGVEATYLIGGFGDYDTESDPHVLSYSAPLVLPFIGEKVGHCVSLRIGGKLKNITLNDISVST